MPPRAAAMRPATDELGGSRRHRRQVEFDYRNEHFQDRACRYFVLQAFAPDGSRNPASRTTRLAASSSGSPKCRLKNRPPHPEYGLANDS